MAKEAPFKPGDEYIRIKVDRPCEGVGRITLAMPQTRNAQDPRMLYEIDGAFTELGVDSEVRVVVLAAEGPDFSSGHDIKDLAGDNLKIPDLPVTTQSTDRGKTGIESHMAFEIDAFMGLCLRWRDFEKPTIAQVQGRAIAGGLMLVWPCDLVVATESASFRDPVVAFGANGHEYFVHTWELGHRAAKHFLFTGDAIGAQEAKALGMVNHVVSEDELESFTLDLASRIATRPSIGLSMAKRSVNMSLDLQGQAQAVKNAFYMHQLCHAQHMAEHGLLVQPDGPGIVRKEIQQKPGGF